MLPILDGLFHNQIFAGALLLMLSGALIALFRKIPLNLWLWLRRKFLIFVEVYSNDDLFKETLTFLYDNGYVDRTRDVTATTKYEREEPRRLIFSPAPGVHFFLYQGWPVWLWRYREKVHVGDAIALLEYFRLKTFGRDRGRITRLLEESSKWAEVQDSNKLVIYADDGYRTFVRRLRKAPRSLSSVILAHGIKDDLIADMRTFRESAQWYAHHGVPYYRTYLFYGPGGTGKTSFIQALASEFGMSISLVNLAGAEMTDDGLSRLFHSLFANSILLIEDIDALFQGRASTPDKQNKLTFSGLLNALDGVASADGRITIMTTNRIEVLDEALIRPGRVDRQIYFGLAGESQAREMFLRFFPGEIGLAGKFAKDAGGGLHSPAVLQSMLMQHRANPWQAISAVESLKESVMGTENQEQRPLRLAAGD